MKKWFIIHILTFPEEEKMVDHPIDPDVDAANLEDQEIRREKVAKCNDVAEEKKQSLIGSEQGVRQKDSNDFIVRQFLARGIELERQECLQEVGELSPNVPNSNDTSRQR